MKTVLTLRAGVAFLDAEFASAEAAGDSMSRMTSASWPRVPMPMRRMSTDVTRDVIDRIVALDTYRIARALAEYER